MAAAVAATISQLENARRIVLGDPTHYAAVVPGILPIIGPTAQIEVQRWGADFLAECFASPVLSMHSKEELGVQVLQLLKDSLLQQQDEAVVKSVMQTAASVYALIFRHITNNPTASAVWELMSTIKSTILSKWDTSPMGIRMCCVKFVQRVVQVQTAGIIADPRRMEQNEISLALVPRDHPLIPLPRMEAEASGLLDRLLGAFQEKDSDAIVVDATLNCLAVLVRSRPSVSNKIVSAVLNFNPFKWATRPLSGKDKVQLKSMERTTRSFLVNIQRRNENGAFAGRIKQHIERLMAHRLDLFEEGTRKRGPPEPMDGLDHAKRQRLGADLPQQHVAPSLSAGVVSYAQLVTLTPDDALRAFDVKQIPQDVVLRICVPLVQRIELDKLNAAIQAVRARVTEVDNRQKSQPLDAPALPGAVDEDDEYEPDFEPQETQEQVINRMEPSLAAEKRPESINVTLGPFKLPQPPPVAAEEAQQLAKGCISRVFSMIESADQPVKPQKAGFNRLAGSNFDSDAWITLITRLATRTPSNLEGLDEDSTNGGDKNGALIQRGSLGDGIRETIFKYIVQDFRPRLNIAISWLNEEWYNDRLLRRQKPNADLPNHYETWALKLIEAITPYLDQKDKALIRFLSEIPDLSPAMLDRVKALARDPDRALLAVSALHYLVLLRPPVRALALDALEDLFKNYQGTQGPAKKILLKFRPQALREANGTVELKADVQRDLSITPAPPSIGPIAVDFAPKAERGSPVAASG